MCQKKKTIRTKKKNIRRAKCLLKTKYEFDNTTLTIMRAKYGSVEKRKAMLYSWTTSWKTSVIHMYVCMYVILYFCNPRNWQQLIFPFKLNRIVEKFWGSNRKCLISYLLFTIFSFHVLLCGNILMCNGVHIFCMHLPYICHAHTH